MAHMKYDYIWGPDIEIRTAAYYQLLICVRVHARRDGVFAPLTTRMPTNGKYFENINQLKTRPQPP